MKTVLLCGCDGYIGHALTLRLLKDKYRVIGVDDFQRRYNVEKIMRSFSATDIQDPAKRHELFKTIGDFRFKECSIDTNDIQTLEDFYSYEIEPEWGKIDAVINLAQQPSAPFSLKSQTDAIETSVNNLLGTINILYFIKKFAPEAHLIQIGSMGEYDHACGVDIAEGVFDFEYMGRTAKNVIYPRRPGSFYHASKVASTYYIDAACRWWGVKATDIMQGVVYGNWTPEIKRFKSSTRLDSDECFGTVVNRFCVQALVGEPLTVYGEGEQQRGYLALNDSVQCLMLALENMPAPGEYRTWNQLDTIHTINEIAQIVKKIGDSHNLNVQIQKIPSPRKEKTDTFEHYKCYTEKLKILGFEPTRFITQEAQYIFNQLISQKSELYPLQNVVNPVITWK